jgi:hypothetical protein
MFVDQQLYRKAFQEYLRKGTPIEWAIKQERPTTRYIWRTLDDKKVRSSQAANDGRVFAWEDPPPTAAHGRGLWVPLHGGTVSSGACGESFNCAARGVQQRGRLG